MNTPQIGTMVFWRFKKNAPGAWQFGFVTDAGPGLVRMGRWHGDRAGGLVVDPNEIEWRNYK